MFSQARVIVGRNYGGEKFWWCETVRCSGFNDNRDVC